MADPTRSFYLFFFSHNEKVSSTIFFFKIESLKYWVSFSKHTIKYKVVKLVGHLESMTGLFVNLKFILNLLNVV